jgi:hypothetical protein
MIDQAIVRKTQMSKSPNPLSNPVDMNYSLNGVPHWMTETLVVSALLNEASKCSETLQEYISGYENPMGEVSGLDLKRISLDMIFIESQDVPYGSTTSQSIEKYRMMITLQKIPQTDGPAPTNKTQLSEWP